MDSFSSSSGVSNFSCSTFRGFFQEKLSLPLGVPIILLGENGSGKTTILEALSLFSPGRGLRSASFASMASFPESHSWHIAIESVHPTGGIYTLSTSWALGQSERIIAVDASPLGAKLGITEIIRMVWATPAFDRLLVDTPAMRRRILDRWIMNKDPNYALYMMRYNRALKERNLLLLRENADPVWLESVEHILATEGLFLTKRRLAFLTALHQECLTFSWGKNLVHRIMIENGVPDTIMDHDDPLHRWKQHFADTRSYDAMRKSTSFGPHRGDWMPMHKIGLRGSLCSTGEQKLMVLTVLLGAAQCICREVGGTHPFLLLLDECFAYLDATYRALILDALASLPMQVWISTCDKEPFLGHGAHIVPLKKRESTLSKG